MKSPMQGIGGRYNMENNNQDVLNSEEVQAVIQQLEERSQKEEKASELRDCLMASYGLACKHEGDEPFKGKTVLNAKDYPDYYGGSYISDSGDYVILVAGSIDRSQKALGDVLPNHNYEIRQVQNSYKKMTETLEHLDSSRVADDEVMKNVAGYWIGERENHIFVELIEYNDKEIEFFKEKILNSNLIKFKEGKILEGEVNVVARPGRTLTWRRVGHTNYDCSIGFRARRNGVNGFVTTAHGATWSTNNDLRIANLNNGRVRIPQNGRIRNALIDAAFCEPVNNINLSQRIQQDQTLTLTATIAGSVVGRRIYQAGQRTGITSGFIEATGVRLRVHCPMVGHGVNHTDLVRASYWSYRGDSGGPAFHVNGGQRNILGVHVTANHYCTAANVRRELGINSF